MYDPVIMLDGLICEIDDELKQIMARVQVLKQKREFYDDLKNVFEVPIVKEGDDPVQHSIRRMPEGWWAILNAKYYAKKSGRPRKERRDLLEGKEGINPAPRKIQKRFLPDEVAEIRWLCDFTAMSNGLIGSLYDCFEASTISRIRTRDSHKHIKAKKPVGIDHLIKDYPLEALLGEG